MADSLAPFDRAAHLRKDVDFLEAALGKASTLLVPVHRDLHPVRGNRLVLSTLAQAPEFLDAQGELVWLGMLGEQACFGVDISALPSPLTHAALHGAELSDLRLSAGRLPTDEVAIAHYTRALLGWHARASFCSVCGQASRARQGGHMRVCSRGSCNTEHFPRIEPCVIVLVTDEARERCVLGRQAVWPQGMYSTLAGFVEAGETVEQCVAREVLEEVGLQVDDVRYVSSQPWPFPASLMLGFTAATRSRELRLDEELQDARWFSRDDLRALPAPLFVPGSHTLAGQLIEGFLQNRAPGA